jgi:hypothetical protein
MQRIDEAVSEMRKALRALALEAPQSVVSDVASKFQEVVEAYEAHIGLVAKVLDQGIER